MVKRQKGITLIALVIAIIVLLILAGVSINLVVGEGGILSKAQNAVTKTEEAKQKELEDLDSMAGVIDNYLNNTPSEEQGNAEGENDSLISFTIDGRSYQAEEGMMLFEFFDSNYYRDNPLPETRECSGCGASMTLSLSGGYATITRPEYAGARLLHSSICP